MKISTIVLAAACASALVVNADEWQSNAFTAVGSGVTAISDLKPTNGSWGNTITSDNAEISGGKVILDVDPDSPATFTVSDNVLGDTNTANKVTVKAIFTPTKITDLPTVTAGTAQLAVTIAYDATMSTPTNYFYVWNGTGWNRLTTGEKFDSDPLEAPNFVPSASTTTTLEITMDYWNSTRKANLAAIDTSGSSNVSWPLYIGATASSAGSTNITLATEASNIASVGISGYGTLEAINGDVQYAVASCNGSKFPSIASAVTYANGLTGADNSVTINHDTSENIQYQSGVKIVSGGGKNSGTITPPASGTMTIKPSVAEIGTVSSGTKTLQMKVSDGTTKDKISIESPVSNKEVSNISVNNNTVSFDLITASSVLKDTGAIGTGETVTNSFRAFLSTYASEAYASADVSASSLNSALSTNGDNGISLKQSFQLGIKPTDSVQAINVPDTAADGISLSIPAFASPTYTSGKTVTYKLYKNGTDTGTTFDSPSAIKIPLGSGTYAVKAVIE